MKKSLLALTVAGALTLGAAQAETVLYGSIRFDYSNSKNDLSSSVSDNLKDRTSNFRDVGSRLGLKGGEDLGNGLQLVFHLEWGFNGMEGLGYGDGFKNRLAYIGLAGDWGTLVVGRVENPFKDTLIDRSVIDDFNAVDKSAVMRAVENQFAGGVGAEFSVLAGTTPETIIGHSHAIATLGDEGYGYNLYRVGNALAYLSPNWSGFSFNAAVIMDNDLGPLQNKKHVDIYTFNAMYEHESGFYGRVGYIQGHTVGQSMFIGGSPIVVDIGDRKTTAWGFQLGYRTEQIGLSASYVKAKLSNSSFTDDMTPAIGSDHDKYRRKDKADAWDIGASYSFGDNYASTVRIKYGQVKYTGDLSVTGYDDLGAVEGGTWNSFKPKEKIWAVGFEHKLTERTRVWVEYENIKESGNHRAYLRNADGSPDASYDGVRSHGMSNKQDTISIGIRHDF